MPGASSVNPRWATPRSLCSPTATTWTTSSSAPSPGARICCASHPSRPRAARTCVSCCLLSPAASSSPRSTSSSRRRRVTGTRAVFGDYISVYDIQRAVEDGATVPIYYESRLASLALDEAERPRIDPDFDEVTEGEEVERKEKLKTKWAQLEAVVGSGKRLELVARDIVEHFENRLHHMYLVKPMRAHGLMQAIARVNRVFRDKPGGLVVDYLGLAVELRQA